METKGQHGWYLADRSNPYWDMLLEIELVQKWTYLDPETNEKRVNWEMVLVDKNACLKNPGYNPFRKYA